MGGEREPALLSLKMQVFTGSNGLCHHYATTVRCRLAAVMPEPHPLRYSAKPWARTHSGKEEPYENKPAFDIKDEWASEGRG